MFAKVEIGRPVLVRRGCLQEGKKINITINGGSVSAGGRDLRDHLDNDLDNKLLRAIAALEEVLVEVHNIAG